MLRPKHLLTTLFAFFCFILNSYGQNVWQKIIGTPKVDKAESLILTADGNILVSGSTESFGPDREIWLGKLSLSGELLWQKSYNTGSFWNIGYDVIQTSDSTYFITGSTWANSCGSGESYGLSTDLNGNTKWLKVYCLPNLKITDTYSVVQAPNGDLVYCGTDLSAQSQNVTTYVTDADGNVKWAKSLGTMGWETGNEAIVTSDTNVVAVGYWAQSGLPAGTDAFIVKYNIQTGDTLWTRRINIPAGYESFSGIMELNDGTLLATGYKSNNPWFVHMTSDAQIISEKTLSLGPNTITYVQRLIRTPDGNFAITGLTGDGTSNARQGLLAKLSAGLDLLWVKTYGGDQEDILYDIVAMPDGGFCMVGETKSFGDPNSDIWIIKTDSLGNASEHFLRGKVYLDANGDCLEDPGEVGFPNAFVRVLGNNDDILRLTDNTGLYKSLVLPGAYTLTASANPPYWNFCNNPQAATVQSNTPEEVRDFAAQPAISCPYISLDLSMPFLRICTPGKAYGQICNTGSAPALMTQVRVTLDTLLTLDSASMPYTALGNNTFLLETGDLGLFECRNFQLYITPSCDAPIGWFHCIDGHAFPDVLCHPDADTAFVSVQECSINWGSYDPNDKRAFPAGEGDEHFIPAGTEIKYQVRFQNTGTAPALQVVVLDTLSPFLDPYTFRTGVSSHPYRLEWLPGNILKFIFDPIFLPDSNANEAESHGFLDYYLHTYSDLPSGTEIRNTANIFFDHNAPVRTNTWVHTIGSPTTATTDLSEEIAVYPNPAQGQLSVLLPSRHLPAMIRMTDVLGRVRLQQTVSGERERLGLSGLESGWYCLSVFDERQAWVKQTWVLLRQ